MQARVDSPLNKVDNGVEHQHHRCQEHDEILHHGKVTRLHRGKEQLAKPRKGKHILDHNRSQQRRSQLNAENRDDRDGSVAQPVADKCLGARVAKRAGSAHVVRLQDIDN